MAKHPIWFQGNLNPSITETITKDDGTAVDLTSSTVKFKMRAVGVSTLKVDAAATIVNAPLGQVRYDWVAADVDTAGSFLVWWEVTTGGKKQDLNEAVVEFRAHAPQNQTYLELEELKSTLELTASFADSDVRLALIAASRGIDELVGRRFYKDVDANQVRYYGSEDVGSRHRLFWDGFEYVPDPGWKVRTDDLVSLTKFETDNDGDGVFENTWTLGADFVLEPMDAPADGRPYTTIRVPLGASFRLPSRPDSIKITGQFGWSAVPEGIKQATSIIATRLLRRTREAPFGVVSIGLDGAAVRAASIAKDPDVMFLLEPYMRRRLFV